MTTRSRPSSSPLPRPRTRAFTFAEIMFAVVILGIGFIMVAAMFPVAIRQTQSTLEDLAGVAEAKRGAAIMHQLGTSVANYMDYFATQNPTPNDLRNLGTSAFGNIFVDAQDSAAPRAGGPLHSFFEQVNLPGAVSGIPENRPQVPYELIKGNLINQNDRRVAFIPIAYQAGLQALNPANNAAMVLNADNNPTTGSDGVRRLVPNSARIWILAVQKRNPDNPEYTAADRDSGSYESHNVNTTTSVPFDTRGCFKPREIYFKLVEGEDPTGFGVTYPDTLVFTDINGTPKNEPAAAEGTFVWVADDRVTVNYPSDAPYYQRGALNGRFYRLGAQLDEADFGPGVWELASGYDMQIVKNPGKDSFYGTGDDKTFEQHLENLPPRDYDSPHPYATRTYSGIAGASSSLPAKGFMIGKGLKNPAQPYSATNPYVGTAQDLFALPLTVTIKN